MWEVVDSEYGYMLVRDGDRWSVVREYGEEGNQVAAVMPGDQPGDGLTAIAKLTSMGIGSITRGYSRSYAKRVYRDRVRQAREWYEWYGGRDETDED
ncbi:MAG: hypothetical protein KM310_10580 [Clostridiales bacterium]|nr:hypothetical protein [Clostridiales bacterium]